MFASFSFDVIHITICFIVKATGDDGILFILELLCLITNMAFYVKDIQWAY